MNVALPMGTRVYVNGWFYAWDHGGWKLQRPAIPREPQERQARSKTSHKRAKAPRR